MTGVAGIRRALRYACAALFFGVVLAPGMSAHAASAGISAASNAANTASDDHHANRGTVAKTHSATNPRWTELTRAQQQALAPLSNEWDKLDSFRKNKWLSIGNRFGSMTPQEQQRVHNRMRDWAKLTPEQRRVARSNYARARKLNPHQKSARWQQYQQLSAEQKKKLVADAASRKHVATVIPPTSQGKHHKTLPPIKSAPKPTLERSVTPQMTRPPDPPSSSPQPEQK